MLSIVILTLLAHPLIQPKVQAIEDNRLTNDTLSKESETTYNEDKYLKSGNYNSSNNSDSVNSLNTVSMDEMYKSVDKLTKALSNKEACNSCTHKIDQDVANWHDKINQFVADWDNGVKDNNIVGAEEVADSVNIKNSRNHHNRDTEDGILVFVSFSMPAVSLRTLSEQSQHYNAKLVMRGIHKNSFKETKDKILEISKNGLSYSIDPQLFQQYNVKIVPTFILIRNHKEVNRLSGNVSLQYAFDTLNKGDLV